MGINDVPKTELIERAAKELQKNAAVQPPGWAMFAKTGTFKERQPVRYDWWFVRAAAVLRRLSALHGPVGVQKVRALYGGRKNKGHKPEQYYPGSGSIIRKIFQQLDKAGLSKKVEKGERKGRIITPQGLSLLGKIADAYMKEHNIVLPKKPEGELNIVEAPKEKKARVRKKPATAVSAGDEMNTPDSEAESIAPADEVAAEKPKRVRAPRKKKAEAVPATPAPAGPAAPEQKPAQ